MYVRVVDCRGLKHVRIDSTLCSVSESQSIKLRGKLRLKTRVMLSSNLKSLSFS